MQHSIMPVYEYSALDAKGRNTSGIVDAESTLAAKQKIRNLGNYPTSVKEIYDLKTKKQQARSFTFSRYFTRVRASEIALMTRQLATLLNAGLPLVTAIDTLIPQTKSHVTKAMLAHIKDTIVEGNSFADALGMYPGVFSSLYINMVRAGESSGTLEIVLSRLADITEKQQALNQRITSALVYPLLMAVIGILVLFFLLTVVVPQITAIFADMGQTLPLPTRMLIRSSEFVKSFWYIFIILAVVGMLAIHRVKKIPSGRIFFDRSILGMPFFGNLYKKLTVSRFSRTLGSLLLNGVSMLPALEIVKNISHNILFSRAIESAAESVGNGKSLAVSLADTGVFPHLPIQMIQIGEQSGELEIMLDKIADIFEREVESTITNLTALLDPVMILLMAVVVGFIVLSIALPIFEMNRLVM
ncbi:MAG: type II secretion system inner membrane protein GspF [Desulfobacterales bacterium]